MDSIETKTTAQREIEVAHADTKPRPQRPAEPPIEAKADEASADVPAPPSSPTVPPAVLQALKHLKWLPDGRAVSYTHLDVYKRQYKALVTKDESIRYWKITPDYDGVERDLTPTADQINEARRKGIAKALATKG